jgi:pyridoxine 4-dehydrogenase
LRSETPLRVLVSCSNRSRLDTVAARLGTSPLAVALAWLLHRSPNILLIPGTSSVEHLRANVTAADLTLPNHALDELDAL